MFHTVSPLSNTKQTPKQTPDMKRLTVKSIENLKLDTSIAEQVKGKGSGTLFFKNRNGVIEAYYRYYHNKVRVMLKIGLFKVGNGSGFSLSDIREKALEYSQIKLQHPNLKEHFEYQEQQKIIQQKVLDSSGNFKEMLDSYINTLTNERTNKNVVHLFNHDIWEPFPELKLKKPADVDENDIIIILKKVFDRGVTTSGNRLRSYLSAAFNNAIKSTNDPLKQDKRFNVQRNPVMNIPKQPQFERIVERSLSREEVRHFFKHIDETKDVSFMVASLLKFLFYIGGQRPLQVLREGWDSYDYRKNTLLITDTKGRSGKREYLTPLTPKALDILNELPTHEMDFPFTTIGKVPLRIETLLKAIKKYCHQFEVESFTPRDIRRTVKNLMIDAGVNRESRNLIQNHGLTGIDFKHYDKHDHLPEKIAGMAKYDRFLDSILNDETDNVVQLITA